MKAIITVIDDDGKLICKDEQILPVYEKIIDSNYIPIKEIKFSFVLRQYIERKNNESL